MENNIKSVAVLGSGTMGAGIAALAADNNCKVLLLDISEDAVNKGKERIINEKKPLLSDLENIKNIDTGTFENDFHKIENYDWICEVVLEEINIKRDIFKKIEQHKNETAIVSSNTSGIPLKDITKNMSEKLLKNVCITHFFNPVEIMKLCELIPGEKTDKEVINKLSIFLSKVFNKGVVYGKDTVNFIGNRIGCFFMLKGLHEGKVARSKGISLEEIDALLSRPMGLPPTGLYGLIDLIGLDVMHSVGKNLKINLPDNDVGLAYTKLPNEEQNLFANKQLGRKTGGGFYRIIKSDSGEKIKETYDLDNCEWKTFKKIQNDKDLNIILEEDNLGNLAWNIMGSTLLYAADLIPEIADDILNIDRAMRWGFAWQMGPFEIIDKIGPKNVIKKCLEKNNKLPKMLQILKKSGNEFFYNKNMYLDLDGNYKEITS